MQSFMGQNVQILLYTDGIFFFSIISQVSVQLLVNVMKFVLISTLGTQCVFELVMVRYALWYLSVIDFMRSDVLWCCHISSTY